MKKFKFRLEPLLKIRAHREKECQKEHSAAQHRVNEQEVQLDRLDGERLQTMKRQRDRLIGKLSVAETLICSRYLLRLKRNRLAGVELLHGLQKDAEKKRDKLVKAARDRKIYELLKEKQQVRHMENMERQEQKELDEVAMNSFRQKERRTKSP